MSIKIAVLMPQDSTFNIFITPLVKTNLSKIGEILYNNSGYDPSVMIDMLRDADVCITGWGCPSLDEEILRDASKLRLVVHTGGTVAAIVSPSLIERNIPVISGNELYAESVAEGTLAYMLAGLRQIPFYNSLVQNGEWRPEGFGTKGLLDKNVGLVGFGAISRYLVPLLKPFNVKIMVHSNHLSNEECLTYGMIRAGSLEEIFSWSDVVSLHMARTTKTYHIINKDILKLMPDGALLVNTARGSVIDEQALADELCSGRIHAVLDVFEEEPLPKSSRLRGLDNVILIPHMAGPTGDRYERVTLALLDDVRRFISGENLKLLIDADHAGRMTNDAIKLN